MTHRKMHLRHGGCRPSRCAWSDRLTEKHAEVTCGTCRRLIRSRGLKERSDFPDVPTFTVQEIERFRGGRLIGCRCPVCGAMLTHGGGLKHGDGDGHRCAHCDCWPRGYYISEGRAETRAT